MHRRQRVLIVYRIPDTPSVKKVRLHESGPCLPELHARGSSLFHEISPRPKFFFSRFAPQRLTHIENVVSGSERHWITSEFLGRGCLIDSEVLLVRNLGALSIIIGEKEVGPSDVLSPPSHSYNT